MNPLLAIADTLSAALAKLNFEPPVSYVYNPLTYARAPYRLYVERYGTPPKEVLLFGMNPGPFGMTQTGVPFGEVDLVREWLGIEAEVGKPPREHPRRPVQGFSCPRHEVSGQRLWGWARDTFGTPERFFIRFFVANYCPLVFIEESGRNRTPDQLPKAGRYALTELCDESLRRTVAYLRPTWVIGIGRFATARAYTALGNSSIAIGALPHPSPANPAANRNWGTQATQALRALGIAC